RCRKSVGGGESGHADEIRGVGFETRGKSGVNEVGRGEGIHAGEMIGLADERIRRPAAGETAGIADSEIRAGSALDAVVARILVTLEQRRGVEDEALRVLVGNTEPSRMGLVRAHEN